VCLRWNTFVAGQAEEILADDLPLRDIYGNDIYWRTLEDSDGEDDPTVLGYDGQPFNTRLAYWVSGSNIPIRYQETAETLDSLIVLGLKLASDSEISKRIDLEALRKLFESPDPQTIINTTKNYLTTCNARAGCIKSVAINSAMRGLGLPKPMAEWLTLVTTLIYVRACSKKNVVVLADDQSYHFSAHGVVADFLVDYEFPENTWHFPGWRSEEGTMQQTFRVVVFREGVLVKGEWVDESLWEWQGMSERVGSRIVKFKRCDDPN
jgi:hypothetical protein